MNNTGDAFDDASRDPRDKMSPLRHDMDFSGSRPASMSPLEYLQDPVDKSLPSAQEPILLTQHRGPRVPPSASNSEWSKYTTSDTARTAADANPIHSQGPSHFAGRLGYDKDAHNGSRPNVTTSPSSHDSRGSMLASQGPHRQNRMGSNTGMSSFAQSYRVENNLNSTFQRASCQRAGVPPLAPDPGCTPEEFLQKEAATLSIFPRLSRIPVLHGPVPEDKLDTIRDVIHPDDWPRFVVGDILFKHLRFHKDFMLLPTPEIPGPEAILRRRHLADCEC